MNSSRARRYGFRSRGIASRSSANRLGKVERDALNESTCDGAGDVPDENAEDHRPAHHLEMADERGGHEIEARREVEIRPLPRDSHSYAEQQVEQVDFRAHLEGVDEIALGQGCRRAEACKPQEES